MTKTINLGVLGIDHGHIFDMLDEMLKEGCNCNYFWTEGSPLTLDEFSKKYPQIKSGRKNFKNYNQKIERTLKLIKQYFKKN